MGSCPIRRGSRGRATPFSCSPAEAVGALAASRGRVLALRAAGRTNPLTRPPHPASAARRPKAGGFSLLKKLKLGGARPKAAQLEPVGMWAKAGEPVGNPCGQARGQAQPVHQLVQQGCPRAERSEPAGGRLRPSSTYPRAGKGAKRPRRAKPGEQARRALQPA